MQNLIYLYLGGGLAFLSGLFNFYLFEKLFTSVPVAVSALCAFLVAGLMFGLLWRIEDRDNHLVWILCAKISVITTVGAVFMSQVASTNAQETVAAHVTAKQYMESALENDHKAQEVWMDSNRITHAADKRKGMDRRLASYVDGAKKLEQSRNGQALMAESLDKIPGNGGLAFLVLVSLLLALVLDLGCAKCIKIHRQIQGEGARKKRPRKRSAASFDTGTTPGTDKRYQLFCEAIQAGSVLPNVRTIKEEFRCSYPIASSYLAKAAEDGYLSVRVNAQGGKVYSHLSALP